MGTEMGREEEEKTVSWKIIIKKGKGIKSLGQEIHV